MQASPRALAASDRVLRATAQVRARVGGFVAPADVRA